MEQDDCNQSDCWLSFSICFYFIFLGYGIFLLLCESVGCTLNSHSLISSAILVMYAVSVGNSKKVNRETGCTLKGPYICPNLFPCISALGCRDFPSLETLMLAAPLPPCFSTNAGDFYPKSAVLGTLVLSANNLVAAVGQSCAIFKQAWKCILVFIEETLLLVRLTDLSFLSNVDILGQKRFGSWPCLFPDRLLNAWTLYFRTKTFPVFTVFKMRCVTLMNFLYVFLASQYLSVPLILMEMTSQSTCIVFLIFSMTGIQQHVGPGPNPVVISLILNIATERFWVPLCGVGALNCCFIWCLCPE